MVLAAVPVGGNKLVAEGRQSCLALGANARIQIGKKSYVIK